MDWICGSSQLMLTSPMVLPVEGSIAVAPSADGMFIVTVLATVGVPTRTCQLGLFFWTAVQKAPRRIASPICVVPVVKEAFWKSGELVVIETSLVPSKLSPLENFMSRGTIVTGTVVVAEPLAGLVPTMV